MDTKVLLPTRENIICVSQILKDGGVIGIPTETVYGLACNALCDDAVKSIFKAKGRPQDNPLIVHISSKEMLGEVAVDVSPLARRLAEKFWPGPLTMIFKKSEKLSLSVTAGLDTVAVRCPSHPVALDIIKECGLPLAAPSANRSGKPSPTTAQHVYSDLDGRIPAIVDGGSCEVGVESTVIAMGEDEGVVLLRPGAITREQLETVAKRVVVAHGVLDELDDMEQPLSPGMKHKHYSPKTKLVILDGELDDFIEYVKKKKHDSEKLGVMVFDGEEDKFSVPCVTYGEQYDQVLQAKLLFSALRNVDDMQVDIVYARSPVKDGVGLAIYNRLIRAAGFEVITI